MIPTCCPPTVTPADARWALIVVADAVAEASTAAGYQRVHDYCQRHGPASVLLICANDGQQEQSSAADMAERLGIVVLNNTPVTRIDHSGRCLETPLGRFDFETLIVAPAHLADNVDTEQALCDHKRQP
ncbi:hypothetical protein [Oceanobacter sp. 4_MG-2023]|uniref:hypothetical protein n=1 Tax=Oceanobacter sp. 4_MG-2023 TaxID=3062623 RepID=UPI002737781E|nr:hypothetical protein [Oceanobacter sp. 4_MG-2023]MDP2547792.1 hypothetical protein [Oceanobacter sp. 4_MG-2023]